jgi:tetratricopeptide (TPR) repeat protein
MINVLLERAQQLVQSGRYADAEKEIRNILAQDPNSPEALALFAICRAEQGHLDEALQASQNAISKAPDNDYYLYLYGLFQLRKGNLKDSEKSIRNAIAFNPEVADYFGVLATIKINQKDWNEALKYANEGLAKDPDNLLCLNSRSTALYKLDRKDDAYSTIQEALNQDPENESTHANLGWSLLEQGDHKRALEHFRESLRLNPNNELAKAGLVEGLKARYWFYRIFLKYAFWLSNMRAKGQWIVILGMYFGVRFLSYLSETNSTLELIFTPVIYLYFIFAISTWIIEPLSNLFLRLNVYGRYALTESETTSSNFVGISLLIGLAGVGLYLFSGSFLHLMVLFFGLTMMIPLASMFNPPKKSNQKILIGYTVLLAVIGLIEILQYSNSETPTVLGTVYIFGIVAYQWIANALIVR